MKLETVERIERQLAEIDEQIITLETQKAKTLLNDEEYAGYIQAYQAYYDDEPLTIREYYRYMDELQAINRDFKEAGQEGIEECFRKHGKRLQELERMLAA